SWVIAKSNLGECLERELLKLEASNRAAQTTIFMSSATDPYQGVERKLGLARNALEILTRHPVRRILLQTRSPLVERDLDLIAAMGDRAIVSITLETDDDAVRRAMTPTSPSISRRARTAQLFRERGVFVQLAISPMMPNHPDRLAEIAARCA